MAFRDRLTKMEKALCGKHGRGRIVTVIGGSGYSDDDVRAFLATNGIVPTENDTVIFRRIVAPGPEGPVSADTPLRIAYRGGNSHDDWISSGALEDDATTVGA